MVAALHVPRFGAVSGSLHLQAASDTTPVGWYWRFERWLRHAEARVHSAIGVSGSIYATWRLRWQPLPAGLILDDLYLPMQQVLSGSRIGFVPEAIAREQRPVSRAHEFGRKARTLTGVYQLCAWLPSVLMPWRNPVWLQFVSHKLLRLATPYLLLFVLLLGGILAVQVLSPVAIMVLAISLVCAAILVLACPPLRRRAAAWGLWGASLLWALVIATVNALQGRWEDWHPPASSPETEPPR